MTPQLQQAIRLLQLPSLDLQAHVRETLETNVMLEAEDEPADVQAPMAAREREERACPRRSTPSSTATALPAEQRDEPEVEIADEAWGEQTSGPSDTPWSGDDDRSSDFSDQHGQTLQEQLIEQLELAKLSPIDMAIARVITDAITDDGYLKDDLEDIRLSLLPEIEATAADVERVLARGSVARARRRRRAQPGRMHRAAAAPAASGHAGAGYRDSGGARTSRPRRRPAARAAAQAAALQRERSGDGARAGALLPSAARCGRQPGAGGIRDSGCVRAPHRTRLDRRDQPGDACRASASTRATPI